LRNFVLALLLAIVGAVSTQAQAPTPLPGFSVQAFAGYVGVQGQADGNGLFTELETPVHTWNMKYTATAEIGVQNFMLSNPNTNYLGGMGRVRFQFSNAQFMDGQVFQPFVNFGLGESRNACVAAANCPAGVTTKSSFAYGVGGGLDIVTSSHMTWRLFEYNRIQLQSGPVLIGNTNQFITGFGFHF
jgi:hypothetical protein